MINCTYLHIPFCKKKCKYCSFCSFPLLKRKEEYIISLIKEIKHYYKNNLQKTIYFGGGTPSLLDVYDIEKILNCFNFDNNTEITLETNPITVNFDKFKKLKNIGINRISLGVQSFDNAILNEIGRLHTKKDIFEAVENILNAGFKNYSIDLMYGLNNQSPDDWIKTLDTAIELNPNHISLYGLKIEQGTYYYKFPPKNAADDDMQAKMYEIAIEKLKEKYIHYEFSNFAMNENYFSKHNLCYWNRENYFGFGLSASGFIDNKRYTNTCNFKDYIINPTVKTFEMLTKKEQIEEEIFLGLRKTEGINFNYINNKYNIDIFEYYKKEFNKFLNEGFMQKTKKGVKLALKGVLVSNEILCNFIEL